MFCRSSHSLHFRGQVRLHLLAWPTFFSPRWSQDIPHVSKLRLTASIVSYYPKTQQGTPDISLYLTALAVGFHTERRDMADGWLLKGVEDLVNKVKLLEREKREAAAKMEALERDNCEQAALIAQVSAKVAEALKEGTTADIS